MTVAYRSSVIKKHDFTGVINSDTFGKACFPKKLFKKNLVLVEYPTRSE